MRLIDADALIKVIQQNDYMLTAKHNSMAPGMFTSGIRQAVNESPTIDAVPVVRCGECIKPLTECPFKEYMMLKTDYCSYGEKMESEGEDGTNTILERRGMG